MELILALTILEWVALSVYWRLTGRGVPGARLAANLASGGALLIAIRLAIADAWWGWLGLCLALAGLAHLVDLRQRWREK